MPRRARSVLRRLWELNVSGTLQAAVIPGRAQAPADTRAGAGRQGPPRGRALRQGAGQLLGNGTPVSRQTVYRALGMLAT